MPQLQTQLHAELIGDRTQPTIVLLHGFFGSGDDWRELIAELGDQYAYLLIDLPGHGSSLLCDQTQYSMEKTAQLVVQQIEDRIPQAHQTYLYGYSMGGRLALYLALHYPSLFSRVILESASPGLSTAIARQQRQQSDAALAAQLDCMGPQAFSDFLSHWYAQPLFQSLRQHPRYPSMLARRSRNHPAYLAHSLRYMGTGVQPNLWPQLPNLQVPLHYVTGAIDQKFVQIQAAMVQTNRCQANLTITASVIQQTGHNVHLENPAAILREITSFFG